MNFYHPKTSKPNFGEIKKSTLPFWSPWFGHFCHFSPKLNFFASGSLWFQFYCQFGPKMKLGHICLIKSFYFILFRRGKMIISFL
ncbi:hypothetical protein Hanom_Chr14g01317591 [Helianthus anomalus]